MAYHVQAEIRCGTTVYIGWFGCGDLLSGKYEDGFVLVDLWPGVILMDKNGADGSDLRSITQDSTANSFRAMLQDLK